MFRKFAEIAYTNLPGSEGTDVKNFLANSTELKEMRKIHLLNTSDTELSKITQEIDNAVTFKQILNTTERLDFNNTNDPTVKHLGRNGMNLLFFVGGYFNPQANFTYYMLHLREKVIDVMAQKGYQVEATNQIAQQIYQLN